MLDSLPIALAVGTLFGFLAGLGIGGGSLLILWLTAVLGMEPSMARGINLLFFLPAACIACLFRFRQGTLHWKRVIPAIAAGCASAAAFSVLSGVLDLSLMKKMLGLLFLGVGIRELFWRESGSKS